MKEVKKGTKSAYEVTLRQKNEYSGNWLEKTVPVNNFGLLVAPSNDLRRADLNVQMYYLDRFQAA